MRTTEEDEALLNMLTTKVRLLSLEQVAKAWAGDKKYVRRRLRRLSSLGLIAIEPVNVRPMIELATPIVRWLPGDDKPNFHKTSYRLQSRWKGDLVTLTACWATKQASHIYGGRGGGPPHRSQLTHDLHLSEVFVQLLRGFPEHAKCWVGEDSAPGTNAHDKVPDALLLDSCGKPDRVIEFGGAYGARRVELFHNTCSEKGLAYELW